MNIARLNGLSVDRDFLPDLVVWPETAWPHSVDITAVFPAPGGALLTGAVFRDGERHYNAALYVGPTGRIVDKYFKRRLVPFAEEKLLGDLIPSAANFSRGAGPRNIARFAPLICYESAWSDAVAGRPEFILNITNDNWIAGVGAAQHLDMARRAAIETGLPVVFANNSGPSAVIDGAGRVLSKLDPGIVGFLDARIPPHRVSIYRRIGLNGMMGIILLVCAGLLFAFRKKRDK
jgi:apolipoprotein N-acyltransferase